MDSDDTTNIAAFGFVHTSVPASAPGGPPDDHVTVVPSSMEHVHDGSVIESEPVGDIAHRELFLAVETKNLRIAFDPTGIVCGCFTLADADCGLVNHGLTGLDDATL
jgi:hypothetical protein